MYLDCESTAVNGKKLTDMILINAVVDSLNAVINLTSVIV